MPEPTTETIKGKVARVRFHNADNGYCILMVEGSNSIEKTLEDYLLEERIACVGYLPAIRIDEEYEFTGQWTVHHQYGNQFQFTQAEVVLPSTTEGAVRYLSSLARGVGPSKAQKIVESLGGEKALDVILEEPEKLYKLDFLKQEQADEIVTALMENTHLTELSALISGQGVGPGTVAKIFAQYGKDAVKIIQENPYVIADDVFGLGFKKTDVIARRLGVPLNSQYRIQAAYTYMLQEATNDGHVYLSPNETIPRLEALLGKGIVSFKEIGEACRALQDKGRVVREPIDDKKSAVYYSDLFRAEVELADKIRRMLQEELPAWTGIEDRITAQENNMKIEYAPEQRMAVATALQNPLSVITGGPGTGKSTVTKAICNIYSENYPYRPIYLASPTGKAAKRLEEATGREAKTIHRLLMFHPIDGFRYNEYEPLPGAGLLIVDEVSMLDIELANHLFKAIDEGMTVALVGDIDQLPSVGPGCVLRDIIDSGVVPTVRLAFNYRQAGGSKIAEYAHWIVSGRVPPIVIQDGDYECRLCNEPDEVLDWLKQTVEESLEKGMGTMDFQVLATMKRGTVGVDALNDLVRELVNPPAEGKPELQYGKDNTYRMGDKVMVIKNDYKLGVFNGDMGVVKEVKDTGSHKEKGIYVDIDGWKIFFSYDNIKLLTHAYAITIHKSQGSEFKLAIVVCTTNHFIMLQRNLIYTAITRAKDRLVLLTNERALKRAVQNDKQAERLSLLKQRLRGEG